jgi:hypothetical protein
MRNPYTMKLSPTQREYLWSLVYCAGVMGEMSRDKFLEAVEAMLFDDRATMEELNPTFRWPE